MMDQSKRLNLFAATCAALVLFTVPASADVAPEVVKRDVNGLALVQISAAGYEGRQYIPLTEYLRLQVAGQAPISITMNSVPTRRISPDAIGAQWSTGVFR